MATKYLPIISGFTLAIALIWAALILIAAPRQCPDKIGGEYYACNVDADCHYDLKYECINNRTLSCVMTGNLATQQEVMQNLECVCVNKKCEATLRP